MKTIEEMFQLAADFSLKKRDRRSYYLGCTARRGDGAIVLARNEQTRVPVASAHAEARISKKLDYDATVYVVRVISPFNNPEWAMAKPCPACFRQLRLKKVKRIYYTVGPSSWDFIDPSA